MMTENAVPKDFEAIFRSLVLAFPSRGMERDTVRVYHAVLRDVPLAALRQSARTLARTNTYFPSTGEWFRAARRVQFETERSTAERTTASCQCEGRGLLKVRYHSGEAFDIAICDCRAGTFYRAAGERFVRTELRLSDEHRIACVEDFDETIETV